jgi:TP901 family phage tail tape measure protein
MANTEKIVVQVVVKGEKDLQRVGKSADKSTKSFGKMAAGVAAATAAFATINKVIGSSIRTFRDFEFQMAKVKAISGASEKEFGKLSKTAQDLGRTTFFTAQQVAELQTNYSKLGFTTQEILNAQEATLMLATATDSDLARAATVAGAAVRGFGLDASETNRVVDVMTVAFTNSAMDLEKWQTSMTKVAPIAKASGFSIEETAAMMSKLTDAGIEASIAGTSLRNILLKMQDPNSDLTKSFGKTIHSYDQLVPAMQKFVKEGGSMAQVMEVVDLRQAAAFEQMITSTDATQDLIIKMDNAEGSAKKLSEIIGDTFEGAMKRLTSATQGLAIVILEDFGGALKSAVDSLAKFFNKLSDNSDAIKSVLKSIINLTKFIGLYKAAQIAATVATKAQTVAIVAYQLATGTATMATKRMIVSVRRLNTTILKNPYLAAGALLVALATDMFNLRIETDETKSAWKDLNDEIYGDIKRSKERQELVELLKTETVTSRELAKAKESSLKLQREINATEKTREQAERDAIARAEEMYEWTDDLKEAYVRNTLADYDRGLQIKKNTKIELDSAISKAKVLDTTREQTIVIDENTEAKKDNALETSFLSSVTDDYWNTLMEGVLDGTETMEGAEQKLADFQKELIENLLLDEQLSYEQKVKLQKQLTALKLADNERTLESQRETSQQKLALMQEASNAMFAIMSNNAAASTSRDIEALQDQKDAGLITEEEYEQKVEAVQRKAFERKKRMDIAQAIINGALAMTTVAGQTGVLAFAFSPFIAAMTALQIAVIASQKFAQGGMIEEFANGGMVHGKSHAQGGEKFAVGGRVVELEGGEAVINKRSTAMFGSQLSAMNAAGGGVKFADGGLLNQPSFSQQQFNALGQNQMMGAMGSSSKVVVVEADITDSQNSVSVIQSEATI